MRAQTPVDYPEELEEPNSLEGSPSPHRSVYGISQPKACRAPI